ncbi:hypothetical protein C8Q79DRAFT_748911 [Trametes meyenii]|nr:hypothetical protein C8Q79DRAFT_748911 [Trametes meyenii]
MAPKGHSLYSTTRPSPPTRGMSTQSITDEVVRYLGWRNNDRRCMIGASALLCFDFALTFPAEVQHIWKRRFTISTSLYLVLRYSILVQQVLYSVENLLPVSAITDKLCHYTTHNRSGSLDVGMRCLCFCRFIGLRNMGKVLEASCGRLASRTHRASGRSGANGHGHLLQVRATDLGAMRRRPCA